MEYRRLNRGAGILLPISSLPSPYGIGTLGQAAYDFIDQLYEAGMKYWQVLPVGPTSFGDSPYQSFSAFAGNPYFIDLDELVMEGLLEHEELEGIDWEDEKDHVNYENLYQFRYKILRKAFIRWENKNSRITGKNTEKEAYTGWKIKNQEWLDQYSLYMACKEYFDDSEWSSWPENIKKRNTEALAYYEDFLSGKIEFWKFVQFYFFKQWMKLRDYARKKSIQMIGDIPIYVAYDSADVWCNPKEFQLNEKLKPVDVSGCPPDAFSDYGQKWGNPLYDWQQMEKENFVWWKKRMKAAAELYDITRIDHFIGVVRYYAIPAAGIPVDGEFREGPGEKLTQAINEAIEGGKIIVEDLGVVVPGVRELVAKEGYPGMKILEFAFDGNRTNEYLPHMYEKNCVVYTGTHDNETLIGYFANLDEKNLEFLKQYTAKTEKESQNEAVIRMAYASVADVVILQMQDILEKDNSARMNLPSTIGKNWRWRLKPGEFTEMQIQKLRKLADLYAR